MTFLVRSFPNTRAASSGKNIYRGGQLLATQEFTTPPPMTENVVWMNVSSTIQVNGNSLTKVSGSSSWYDAGAVSTQTIAAGDGYVEFTPRSTTTRRICGLGHEDTGPYLSDIEYAFSLDGSGNLSIYEPGVLRGYHGTYASTDRLRVAVEGGAVKYYRNGVLLYTSTVTPQYPLLVDTSLNTVWSTLSNVVLGRGQQQHHSGQRQ